jgi:DNA-directed RNA polymerase I, II, and III subunit RPABC2
MSDDEREISDSSSESENENYPVITGKSKKPVKFNYEDDDDNESATSEHLDENEKNDDESNVDSDENSESDNDDEGDTDNDEDIQKKLRSEIGNVSDEDDDDDDDDDDEEDEDEYFRKFDENIKTDIISEYHPEMLQHNYEEIEASTLITYKNGLIDDQIHRTLPFLTKYEKARVLGERAKQLNSGAKSFVSVDETVIDGYLIAMKELEEKKIPFIIRRPLPNGASEYWKLKDLEIL